MIPQPLRVDPDYHDARVMWLSLSRAGYGIHGTNNPASIGKAVSHGCVRMHNHDVLQLAKLVPNETKVIIEF